MNPVTAGNAAAGALEFVGQVFRAGQLLKNESSLIDVSKVARVEPICLIDADAVNLEYITDITMSLQTIFAGYYLQAISLTNDLQGISLKKKLAPLNPNREVSFESFSQGDSYKYKLPLRKDTVALEDTNVNIGENALKTTSENTNLSVGKLYDVTVVNGEAKASIKIAIRLMVSNITTAGLVSLLTFKDSFDMDLKERWHMWRAGRISFFKDLILCNDLLDKHRKILLKDKNGVYEQILNRQNNTLLAGLLNKKPSLAAASNLIITTTDTLSRVEIESGLKIKDFKSRQRIFDNTGLMVMAVIDKEWERIFWYYRGIHESTVTSVKDIKNSNKNSNGTEVLDIMKSFMSGSKL